MYGYGCKWNVLAWMYVQARLALLDAEITVLIDVSMVSIGIATMALV